MSSSTPLGPLPAQHGVDARHQFPRREGLGDVVIRPALEAGDLVALLGPRREHDDGSSRVSRSRLSERVSSSPLMSGSIQSTSTRSGRASARAARAARQFLGLPTSKPARFQAERDHFPDRTLVLDDQYLFAGMVVEACRRGYYRAVCFRFMTPAQAVSV